MNGTYCHAYGTRPDHGRTVGMLCTLHAGHGGTFHIDTVFNRSWPMEVA